MATPQGLVSGVTNPNPVNVNTSGQPVDYTAIIQNLYKTNLSRDGEVAGIDHYNKQLQSGRSLDDVKNDFVTSNEYKLLHEKQNALAGAKEYYATQVAVDPGKQTVQSQLAGLTDPNSQINARAISQAQQDASKRGLINSSIAGSAAQAAVLDKALPVAQQDAQMYSNVAMADAAAKNTADQFNANSQNQFGLQKNASISQMDLQKNANANQQTLQDKANSSAQIVAQLNANTQLALGSLDAKTKTDLQNIVSKNSQLLQANTSAANATSQLMASIAQVQANDKLDAEAKQTAVNNLINIMNESLRTFNDISGSGLDLSKYFQQQSITPATPAPAPLPTIPETGAIG